MTDHARNAAERIVPHSYSGTIEEETEYATAIIAQAIADATAEQGRRAEWLALLARASNLCKAEWGEAEGGWMQVGGLDWDNDPIRPVTFSDGLPVESVELRTALEAAMKE